jgi:transketolase
LIGQIKDSPGLCVAEEHVRRGSFGAEMALMLLEQGVKARSFKHLYARAHHYERYGSQGYLRRHSKIDADSMLAAVAAF